MSSSPKNPFFRAVQPINYRSSNRMNTPAAAKAPKQKEPSVSFRFADWMMGDGLWSASEPSGSGGSLIYRWGRSHWEEINGGVGDSIAAKWLSEHDKSSAKASTARDAWSFFSMKLLSAGKILPKPDSGDVIVPLNDAYLKINPDGTIDVVRQDPRFGMTWVVNADSGHAVGSKYEISPVRPGSLFAQYLETSIPDPEIRAFIQEQCALTLLPSNFAIASWWVGVGRNGKSVLLELLERFHRRTARISLSALNEPFGMEHLVGASLILADEVENEKWNEGKFKSLVAGNSVCVNRKNQKALASCRIEAKWIISSNQQPFIKDKSEAVWARLAIVNWTVEIPEEKRIKDLDKLIFESEKNQVLDWLLEGAVRIVKRGRFMPENDRPKAVRALKKSYRHSIDSIAAWADETGARTVDKAEVTKEAVYESYLNFCESDDHNPIEKSAFWRLLASSRNFVGLDFTQRRVNSVPKRFVNIGYVKKEQAEPVSSFNGPSAVSVHIDSGSDLPF